MSKKTFDKKLPDSTVVVFGAGVAGLTAAHELAERGFQVTVYEPDPDPLDPSSCDVGGMARTQWSRGRLLEVPRMRLEPAELEAAGELPTALTTSQRPDRPPPPGLELCCGVGEYFGQDPALGFLQHIEARAREYESLLYRVPVIDPDDHERLALIEKLTVVATYTRNELPAGHEADPQVLDAIDTPDGREQVAKVLGKRASERCDDPRERWLVALAFLRCRYVASKLVEELRRMDRGYQFDWKNEECWIFRSPPPGRVVGQLVGRIELLCVGDVYTDDPLRVGDRKRVVRTRIEQVRLPGEHGYRFFPAFYWHVFDTMRRIPIVEPEPRDRLDYRYEAERYRLAAQRNSKRSAREPGPYADVPQGRTVRDNLVPLPYHTITGERGEGFQLPRSRPTSLKGALGLIREFMTALDITARDLARMQVKLAQYMSSCGARRDQYARSTWLQYLGDGYSEGFARAMQRWPRALVGLQADRADARTYGDVVVQLILDQLRDGGFRDGTLNAPTSVAWFDPWRRYLESQGVAFRRGRLIELDFDDEGEIAATVLVPGEMGRECHAGSIPRPGYYVLAVPPVEARALCVRLRERASVRGDDLAAFEQSDLAAVCDMLDVGGTFKVSALGQKTPGGALQHYSGVQFYLDQDHRLFNGHAYYPQAPWALSSVSQVQFRLDPPDPLEGYRGVVSVDVGSWDEAGLDGAACAWDSTGGEIADEVWQQICAALGAGEPDAKHRPSRPRWYHIDTGILRKGEEHGRATFLGLDNYPEQQPTESAEKWRKRAAESPILGIDQEVARLRQGAADGRPYFNRTPYLVSTLGAWDRAPGAPGRYKLAFGTVALAGTYMRTHTRLATMEAANESGRHAANAIIHDYRERLRDNLVDRTDVRTGELCETRPLLTRELDDLDFLKDLDAALVRRGLPHMFEILEVEAIVDELVPRGVGADVGDADEGVVGKIADVLEQFTAGRPGGAGAFLLAPLQALLGALRRR